MAAHSRSLAWSRRGSAVGRATSRPRAIDHSSCMCVPSGGLPNRLLQHALDLFFRRPTLATERFGGPPYCIRPCG